MLLLFVGAIAVPVVAGVRAYATVSYSTVDDGDTAFALVNPTSDSVAQTTDAYPTEE